MFIHVFVFMLTSLWSEWFCLMEWFLSDGDGECLIVVIVNVLAVTCLKMDFILNWILFKTVYFCFKILLTLGHLYFYYFAMFHNVKCTVI